MKLYRINKLASPQGPVIKKKDVLATSDSQALLDARNSEDCPICDVLSNGEKIGSVR